MRRFAGLTRTRKDKKVSNDEWISPTDPEAKITKMKDGTTHLAYKAEHVVDLESDLILAAEIRPATDADQQTLVDSVLQAEENLQAAGVAQSQIEEVAADTGNHSVETLELCQSLGLRTYIPEPKRQTDWTWTDKPPEYQRAVLGNRQGTGGRRGKQLQRLRSERGERGLAHVGEPGGMSRPWRAGRTEVARRYGLAAA